MVDSNDEFGDAFGEFPEHQITQQPRKDKFAPWHHPRKQYVRIDQWCTEVRTLLKHLKSRGDAGPFRYLSLPGNELLDVRALHGTCEREGVLLRYLGFNSVGRGTSDETELAISRNEIRNLRSIDHDLSTVVPQRLEDIMNDRAPSFREMTTRGPYHAVNIDLCGSIASHSLDEKEFTLFDVLKKLITFQVNEASFPWLLFLTTRVGPGLVDQRNMELLLDAISGNIKQSELFRGQLGQLFGYQGQALEDAVRELTSRDGKTFVELFCIGFGKWLLKLLYSAPTPRHLTLLPSLYYRVDADHPDMLSLAFRVDTQKFELKDETKLTREALGLGVAAVTPHVSEVDLALKLLQNIEGVKDLDRIVCENPKVCDRVLRQSKDLLASARYSVEEYTKWAAEEIDETRARLDRFDGQGRIAV